MLFFYLVTFHIRCSSQVKTICKLKQLAGGTGYSGYWVFVGRTVRWRYY